MIEFEVKARVPAGLESSLRAKLGEPEATEEHVDTYLKHPMRDFAKTDEALRVSVRGERVEVTYKGPKLDPRTKSRKEIVLPVHAGEGATRGLFEALGFAPVAEVRKRRERFHAEGFEVALDTVPGLGTFLELERSARDGEDRSTMEKQALDLLRRWGLDETERRSYLELLLGAR